MKKFLLLFGIFEFVLFVRSDTCKTNPVAVNWLCEVNLIDKRRYTFHDQPRNTIYVATPTYPRPTQVAELTRLSHTLMHVPKVHWIIAEDAHECSQLITDILQRSGLPYTYITSPKPFKAEDYVDPPYGVAGRMAAINWLRSNVKHGILYFANEESVYDLRFFEQIRHTETVSMVPVGLVGKFGVTSPVVVNGKVERFLDSWISGRKFAVTMEGIAINLALLTRKTDIPYVSDQQENNLLKSLEISLEDIEPLAESCTRILVWNTKTVQNERPTLKVNEEVLESQKSAGNLRRLLKNASDQNMVILDWKSNGLIPYVTEGKNKSDHIYFSK